MNEYADMQHDMQQRQQRLESLQNARQWQPGDSIEAAKLDSQISVVRGVIRLMEYRETASCW